jgi:dTDP-4-dehydrorhamnose reductase
MSPDDSLVIDRSLDAAKFEAATGYRAPSWPDMVRSMHDDFMKGYQQNV